MRRGKKSARVSDVNVQRECRAESAIMILQNEAHHLQERAKRLASHKELP